MYPQFFTIQKLDKRNRCSCLEGVPYDPLNLYKSSQNRMHFIVAALYQLSKDKLLLTSTCRIKSSFSIIFTMSIQPEVPYTSEDEGSSDGSSNSWRDRSLRNNKQQVVTNSTQFQRPNLLDGKRMMPTSTQSPQPVSHSYTDSTVIPDTGHRNADDQWVLPIHVPARNILGSRNKSRTNEIQKACDSFIEYNEQFNQVDIWGDEEAVHKTKSFLDMIVSRLTENDTTLQRKTKKWSKPDRELTEKERRREERRQAKRDEEKRYQGLPKIAQDYTAVFPLPDKTLPLPRLVGDKDAYLNQIRADCKAFMWYEEKDNLFRIAADTEEAVKEAASRIRNWYLRCQRKPIGCTLRLMQQPTKRWDLSYRRLPASFVTHEYADPEREKDMLEQQRLLEAVASGVIPRNTAPRDLINFNEEEHPSLLSESALGLNARNEKFIEGALANGLESLRLNDWAIRMKIRYGQICLINYRKKDNQFLSLDDVSEKMFRKSKFKSALAPCISKTRKGLQDLFQYLTQNADAVEYSDNPRTSFAIAADQYPFAAQSREPGQPPARQEARGNMWQTVMQIAFTEDGQRRLWRTMTDLTDLVDISCTELESKYSWDLRVQHARLLPGDNINSPHEKFSHLLRVSPDNRLIMVTSNDYIPRLVTQKTEWRYHWRGHVIEICYDEVWDMNRVERPDRELPVDLTPVEPHRALYKVSLYKEDWKTRFSQNLGLKIGQAPPWTLKDFLVNPDENTNKIMEIVKEFSEILNKNVPLYWGNTENSLV